MKLSTRRRWLLGTALVLCGCDPDVEILGRVVAADGGVAPTTKVELACTGGPQLSVPRTATTDSQGRFTLRGVGCLPPACVLFTGDGFRRVEENLMEWCKKSAPQCGAGTCSHASVTLQLH